MQVIKALCAYVGEDSPLPAPAGACSKVTRRANFRAIVCPPETKCEKLFSLIHHMLDLFEENLTEVLVLCHYLSCVRSLAAMVWVYVSSSFYFRFSLCSSKILSAMAALHLQAVERHLRLAALILLLATLFTFHHKRSIFFPFHRMQAASVISAVFQALFVTRIHWTSAVLQLL